jgi:excisionase family DNA binding protein
VRIESGDNLETTKSIADRVGVSVQQVRDWTAQGLPVQKLGPRTWRYNWAEVEEWLRARDGRRS